MRGFKENNGDLKHIKNIQFKLQDFNIILCCSPFFNNTVGWVFVRKKDEKSFHMKRKIFGFDYLCQYILSKNFKVDIFRSSSISL